MPVAPSVNIGTPNAALLTVLGNLQVKKRDGVTGYDWKGFRLLMRHFWHRLVGSAGVWFCNDWVSLQALSTCVVQVALPAAAGIVSVLHSLCVCIMADILICSTSMAMAFFAPLSSAS